MPVYKRIFTTLCFILPLACLLASCRQKNLMHPEDSKGVLAIHFMWDFQPDANPSGMTLYFYPLQDEGMIWRFDIAGKEGGTVEIPYGRYELIAFNNDLPGIRLGKSESPMGITASLISSEGIARPGNPLFRGTLFIDFTPRTVIFADGNTHDTDTGSLPTAVCRPVRLSTNYNVTVTDIKGAERIRSANFILNSVHPELNLYDGTSSGEGVAVKGQFGIFPANAAMTALFNSFACLENDPASTLEILITTVDERKFKKTFNVSDQLSNISDPLNVDIIIKGLVIPDDGNQSDGVEIDVGVDGWTDITIDYIM